METGLVTDIQWQECLDKYPNVQESELVELRDRIDRPTQCDNVFHFLASSLDEEKLREKSLGKKGFRAGQLFQVFNIRIHPLKEQGLLRIYGKIFNQGGSFYDRKIDQMEVFGQEGGTLTLVTPPPDLSSYKSSMFMSSDSLSIKLKGEGGEFIINEEMSLDYSKTEFEEFKVNTSYGSEVALSVSYMAIPMAVYGCIQLKLFNKRFFRQSSQSCNFLDVYGKVTAKFRDTFGSYTGQEIVLFDKSSSEYQHIGVDSYDDLLKSRCWLSVPAYSILQISVELYDYHKQVPLLSEIVEFEVQSFEASSKQYRVGDIIFAVDAIWHSATPEEFEFDSLEGANFHHWKLKKHLSLSPSPAIEVLSVFVGREQTKTLDLFGKIEFSIDDSYKSDILKIENSFYKMFPTQNIIPLFHGSQKFEEDSGFMINIDLKDQLTGFKVKGFFDWAADSLHSEYFNEKFLCSIIKGEGGFIATHYLILSSAVKATLSMSYKHKTMELCDVPVCGSVFSQLSRFEYFTQYDKRCNRIQLFDRAVTDPVQVEDVIPLERSSFLVPASSKITIAVDLFIGEENFVGKLEFGIGEDTLTIDKEDSELCLMMKWSNV